MDLRELPFTLNDLENPKEICPDTYQFIHQCYLLLCRNKSNEKAKELIAHLKNNPPKVSYENPKIPEDKCSEEEYEIMAHIFNYGIDIPGSKYNLTGNMQYYSEFFIDMFFGNYTEFLEHVEGKSEKELKTLLNKREGHCQYSPIFAPILGIKMVCLENNQSYTRADVQELKILFSGNNEKRHLDIIMKLILLGVDLNVNDIYGFTPLHYAAVARHERDELIGMLVVYGADPNKGNRFGERPLTILKAPKDPVDLHCVEILVKHGKAKLEDKDHIQELRTSVETYGNKELAITVREAMPRDDKECEKCIGPAEKKCSACSSVFYCSLACQKMDWKFHKGTCKKTKNLQ